MNRYSKYGDISALAFGLSYRLALALGWEENRLVEHFIYPHVLVARGALGYLKVFDYRDPTVAFPVMKKFKMDIEHLGVSTNEVFIEYAHSDKLGFVKPEKQHFPTLEEGIANVAIEIILREKQK